MMRRQGVEDLEADKQRRAELPLKRRPWRRRVGFSASLALSFLSVVARMTWESSQLIQRKP
jgi:hypothetical protein